MKTAVGLAHAVVIAVIVFALLMTACQPSTLVSTLEAVVAAAEIAVPVIGSAAGIPAPVLAAIVTYLQLVDSAAAQASTILAGPDTAAVKSAKIIAAFGKLAAGCNCLPAGTPAVVANVIDAVAQAVAKFLSNFALNGVLPTGKPMVVKVTEHDRTALAKIRTRAEQNTAKLKNLKK